MPGSPSHSGCSSASCPNPLFFGIVSDFLLFFPTSGPISFVFSSIVSGSPSHSSGSSASCLNPLFFDIVSSFLLSFPASCPNFLVIPAAFRHRARIPYFPTSCPIFFYLSRHRAWILYLSRKRVRFSPIFSGSVPGSFSPSVIMAHSLSFFMVLWGQNCWSFEFFTRVHFTHSLLALCIHDSLVHSLY